MAEIIGKGQLKCWHSYGCLQKCGSAWELFGRKCAVKSAMMAGKLTQAKVLKLSGPTTVLYCIVSCAHILIVVNLSYYRYLCQRQCTGK
jgi:hypothetical protein